MVREPFLWREMKNAADSMRGVRDSDPTPIHSRVSSPRRPERHPIESGKPSPGATPARKELSEGTKQSNDG
jgi:hypothetical protein